jgi:hypothetical protein
MKRLLAASAIALLAAAPALGATTTVRLGVEPRVGVNAGGHLWVLADRGGSRVLIETGALTGRPTGREVVVATGVAQDPATTGQTTVRPSLTVAGGGLWTVDPTTGDAVRVDPATATVAVRAPIATRIVAAGPSGLWATGPPTAVEGGFRYPVRRLDPATGVIVGEVAFGPGLGAPRELAVGTGGVWVARIAGQVPVVRIDPATGAVGLVDAGSWRLASRAGTILTARRNTCLVSVLPWTGRPDGVRTCRQVFSVYPRDVTASGGSAWLAYVVGKGERRAGWVTRRAFDDRGRPVRTRVGADPVDVVPSRRGVWVLSRSDRTMTRVTP